MTSVPNEAVIAAAKVLYADKISNHAGDNAPQIIDACENVARKVLEAAAPHIAAEATRGVRDLASMWDARGSHDMLYSKTIPDEDIAAAILAEGAAMVENARHIRNALEGK